MPAWFADRCIQACKLDKSDRRARALQTFCQIYWLELLRHAGADGHRLTKDQFVTAHSLAVIDPSRLHVTEVGGRALNDAVRGRRSLLTRTCRGAGPRDAGVTGPVGREERRGES
ncbi:hypothetical protein GCM10023336_42140 [Streptomyces similanensis]|uniref:Uncharacterized protein n=1 Tax=Streptomyces similanensis TaxID=1274988 RepID=A0ABP9KPF7_9ACTN